MSPIRKQFSPGPAAPGGPAQAVSQMPPAPQLPASGNPSMDALKRKIGGAPAR